MAVNIGPRIGIDGEKEYRQQINDLITVQKTFNAQMRELESSFDDSTSAMEKNRKKGELLEKQVKNQEKQVEELEKGLQASSEKYGENATQTLKWKQAVANAKTELNKMKKELSAIPKGLKAIGQGMQTAGQKMTSVGDALTKNLTAPLTALGGLSIAAFNEVDAGLDIVTQKTGATGEALKGLQDSVKNIAGSIPTSFETAGEAIGEVNTRFGVTGQELETLSGKFIKFADLNNTDVSASVDKTQKIMAAFGLETQDAGTLLDAMNKTGQDTGISMDSLQASMIKNASALQSMGMDAYSAASFLGQVETSGANTQTVMSGLSKALTNAAEDGKSLPEALGEFQQIMNSSASDQEKLNAAIDLFGKKAGPAIYNACKEGSLHFENLSKDAKEYMGNVETTFNNVQDAPDRMKIALNNLKTAGSELGSTLLEIAAPAIEGIGTAAENVRGWFESLTDEQKSMVGYATVFAAGIGPITSALGRITTAAGSVIETLTSSGGLTAALGALSSPVGWAALGVGALALAMNTLDEDVGWVDEDMNALMQNTTAVINEMDSATSALSTTLAASKDELKEINDKANIADDLINELEALEKQSSLTGEQQGRMRTIVGELNELYPGLALSIDKSTGKLNKSTKSVRAYVEETKKVALIEAYTKAAQNGYEALAEAHIALAKAQKQSEDNQKKVDELSEEHTRLLKLEADASGYYTDSLTGAVMTSEEYQTALTAAVDVLTAAQDKQDKLNAATEEAQGVYDAAETTIAEYEQAADDLAKGVNDAKTATEGATAATEKGTAAVKDNSQAIAENARELAANVLNSVGKIAEEVKAWDELYKATEESIRSQIGLFDEWQQNNDLSAADMLKNLESQKAGMESFAENMKLLSAEAVRTSDPNLKALVKSIASMGVEGAGYADQLVKAMSTDKDLFNQIVAQYGENNTEVVGNLSEILTYIDSDFKTKGAAAFGAVLTAAEALGQTKAWKSMETGANDAISTVKTAFVNASKSLTLDGKVKIDNTSEALQNAKAIMQNFFNTNPIIAKIKSAVQAATHHADGGFTTTEQLSWLSEGNKPEVVIPLSAEKRATAITLYQQTGQILSQSTSSTSIGIDADELYEAVAAGAERGMENANVKIYLNNRETGRILRNMGVQFA